MYAYFSSYFICNFAKIYAKALLHIFVMSPCKKQYYFMP